MKDATEGAIPTGIHYAWERFFENAVKQGESLDGKVHHEGEPFENMREYIDCREAIRHLDGPSYDPDRTVAQVREMYETWKSTGRDRLLANGVFEKVISPEDVKSPVHEYILAVFEELKPRKQ